VVCVSLALAGCGDDDSSKRAGQAPAAKIHGELINAPGSLPSSPSAHIIAPATAQAAAAGAQKADAYAPVGFDKLASYNFEVPNDGPVTNLAGPDKADEQIPAAVMAWDKRKVTIKGFMLPLKVEDGAVTEFLIMKDQSMCCYGTVPKITEWVSVKTRNKGIRAIMDVPVSICGTLRVGAMRENGYLVGIYQMDAERMLGEP